MESDFRNLSDQKNNNDNMISTQTLDLDGEDFSKPTKATHITPHETDTRFTLNLLATLEK